MLPNSRSTVNIFFSYKWLREYKNCYFVYVSHNNPTVYAVLSAQSNRDNNSLMTVLDTHKAYSGGLLLLLGFERIHNTFWNASFQCLWNLVY